MDMPSESTLEQLTLLELRSIRREMLTDPEVQEFLDHHRKRPSFRDALVCLVAFFGGTLLQLATLLHGVNVGWPLPALVALCLLGLLVQLVGISGFSSLMHECWHKYAVPQTKLNEFIGRWIVAPLFLLSFEDSRDKHFKHHRFVGQDQDPDHPAWRKTTHMFIKELAARWLVVPHVIQAFSRNARSQGRGKAEKKPLGAQALLAILIFHGTWAGSCLAIHWYALFPAYLLPLVLGSTLLTIREFREHFYLEDGRLVTCDITCPLLERLLIAGGYFNYHATHHVFPDLPQRRLPELFDLISSKPELLRRYHGQSLLLARRSSYFAKAYRIGDDTPLVPAVYA